MRIEIAPDRMAYSPDEAAAVLGIGRTTVFSLVAKGELASVKVGSRRLIPVKAVHDFVDRLAAEQQPATKTRRPGGIR